MPWSNLCCWKCCCLLVVWGYAAQAISAEELQYPLSIAVTKSGTIYLADRALPGVWKLEEGQLSKFFQGSPKFRTPLNAIRCVALDHDGKLLAGDSSTRDVYRFDGGGQPVGMTQPPAEGAPAAQESKKTAGPADASKAAADPPFAFGEIGNPMDIAVNRAGDVYVSDLEIHRIVKVAKGGGPAREFVAIQAPRGLCVDDQDNLWVVSGRKLVRVSPAGEKSTVVEEGTFNFPHTVAVAADQTAYVCDGYEKCIWKIPPGGQPEKLVSGAPLVNPVGLRLANDKLYVVDPRAKAIFEVTLAGKLSVVPSP